MRRRRERTGPQPFTAPPGLGNPHVQTVGAKLLRSRRRPSYERIRLDTPDGDFVDLDLWCGPCEPSGVCLLLHGLEGSAGSGYMVSTSEALSAIGVQAVALNFRSCSGEPNRLPSSYHSGHTEDIELVLDWMADRYPDLPLAAVGFSLGGNALLNLLGRAERRTADGLEAAVAVSVPYDLARSAEVLDQGSIRFYGRRFLRSLKAKALEKATRFPELVPTAVLRARTLREFDDLLTAPLHGFRDAADYYARCSAARFLDSVAVPVLIVHAEDDPIVPGAALPLAAMRRRANLTLLLTKQGGHIGFLDRRLRPGPGGWLEQSIAGYVAGRLRDGPPGRVARVS